MPEVDQAANLTQQSAIQAGIARVPSLPSSTLADGLLAHAKLRQFAAREVLYLEGDPADTVHVIEQGMVKLLSYLPNGRARIVRLHGGGDWIGMSGLVQQPHDHTAIAINDVRVYSITTNRLLMLRRVDPDKYCEVMEKWYEHLRISDRWIAEFSTGPIRSRVAHLINYLANFESGDDSVVELLTCEEMGAIIGVTPESVSRILARFKRDKILQRNGRHYAESYHLDQRALGRLLQK